MELKDILYHLHESWNETGFLGLLRKKRTVDFELGKALVENLKKFSLDDSEKMVDLELVRLLWFIPIFLSWQKERLAMNEDNEEILQQSKNMFILIQNEVIRILGCA